MAETLHIATPSHRARRQALWLTAWALSAVALGAAADVAIGGELLDAVPSLRERVVEPAALPGAEPNAQQASRDRTEEGAEEVRGDESAQAIADEPAAGEVSDTITVNAIRAADETPVTKRTLDAEEIETLSYGQDMPSLLQHTPSLTWTSDAGTGSNYSYFSLRGIAQSRINITFDGAPLNDPAEHALFFNNFHDFASAVDSVQIQRGVGTSTVGSPSYGGSINFASAPLASERQASVRLGFGSFDTQRASIAFESGALANGLAVSARVSYADSAGYRTSSGTEHDTIFFNAAWRGDRSQLKLVSFSGRERSQLAFLAVDPETLSLDPRFNPLAREERDRFGQDFAQLQYIREIGSGDGARILTASLYGNGADGYFRLWDDPVAQNDLLEFGIDQAFVGSMVTLSRQRERLSTTFGVHFNDFEGDHTLDIGGNRIYRNTGLKQQANAFVKAGYDLGDWHLFGDAQLRWAEFDYRGDLDLGSVDWTFFDPKIGVRYRLSERASVYASIGKAEREPARLDLLSGEDNASVRHDLEAVRPERVVDLEAGYEVATPRLALQIALYSMQFDDEIAATGELSEVGLPLRINVDESSRRGLELDLRWAINQRWTLAHASSFSRNRIREWTQFYDVFDAQGTFIGSEPRSHRNVEPLLTPPIVVNQAIEWSRRNTELALSARWVAASHLDNTGNEAFRTPSHLRLDLRAAHELEDRPALGSPRIALHVQNLLDADDHYPGGYSYLFVSRGAGGRDRIDGIPFYYPLATRSIQLTLEFAL